MFLIGVLLNAYRQELGVVLNANRLELNGKKYKKKFDVCKL